MGLKSFCGVALFLVLFLALPLPTHCISVYIWHQTPIHVIVGKTLVLEADIRLTKGEQVTHVAWERQAVKQDEFGKMKVAEFPGKFIDKRVRLDKQGAVLEVKAFHREDCGIYTVTVSNQSHAADSASCVVMEYEAVHHVSVSINVSHTSLLCTEAWGTEPEFSWLHDSRKVTEDVGRPSVSGQVLYLSSEPCGRFTCVVKNSLGQQSDTYAAEPCQTSAGGTTLALFFVVILLACLGVLAFFVWRRHRQHSSHGERLQEPHDVYL